MILGGGTASKAVSQLPSPTRLCFGEDLWPCRVDLELIVCRRLRLERDTGAVHTDRVSVGEFSFPWPLFQSIQALAMTSLPLQNFQSPQLRSSQRRAHPNKSSSSTPSPESVPMPRLSTWCPVVAHHETTSHWPVPGLLCPSVGNPCSQLKCPSVDVKLHGAQESTWIDAGNNKH